MRASVQAGQNGSIGGEEEVVTAHLTASSDVKQAALSLPEEPAVTNLVEEQEQAVLTSDRQRYLQTIDERDRAHFTEEKHWFDDAVETLSGKPYERSVKGFLRVLPGEGMVVARVERSYQDAQGKVHRMSVPTLFRETPSGWKDAGPFFNKKGTANVTVRYTHERDADLAVVLAKEAECTVKALHQRYGWVPEMPIEMKLYGNKEWFRQSIKLSLPDWVGGWHEYDESIKFDVSRPGQSAFLQSAVIHETVHQMVGELSRDNASYWLQEGMAEHYQALLDENAENNEIIIARSIGETRNFANDAAARTHNTTALLTHKSLRQVLWPLEELAAINLEELSNEDVLRYYLESRIVVEYFLKTYGEAVMLDVMRQLRDFPYIEKTTSEKLEVIEVRTEQAIEDVLGISFQQFASDWWQSLS